MMKKIIAVLLIFLLIFSTSMTTTFAKIQDENHGKFGALKPIKDKLDMSKYKEEKVNKNAKTILGASKDNSNYISPPGDQGSTGSCVGWALSYAKQYYEHKSWAPSSLDESRMSAEGIISQIYLPFPWEGAYMEDGLDLLVNQGCVPYSFIPWSNSSPENWTFLTEEDEQAAKYFKNTSWSWQYVTTSNLSALKTYLNNNVITMSIPVYDDLATLNNTTNLIYDNTNGSLLGYHAICIVGYDDSKSAFKFINSWGTDWGQNGYGYITYNLVINNQCPAYKMVDDTSNVHSGNKMFLYDEEITDVQTKDGVICANVDDIAYVGGFYYNEDINWLGIGTVEMGCNSYYDLSYCNTNSLIAGSSPNTITLDIMPYISNNEIYVPGNFLESLDCSTSTGFQPWFHSVDVDLANCTDIQIY